MRLLTRASLVGLAAPLLLLLAVIAYFAAPLAEGRMLAPGDGIAYYFHARVLAAAAIRAGELPFWNPYYYGGTPFLAALQAGLFFPANWTFLALPPVWAMNVTVMAAVATAGLSTFAFARALALGRAAALVAALTMMGGGYLTLNVQHLTILQTAGLAGLVLWAIERYRRTLAPRYAVALAAIVALQIFAAHPQMVAYTMVMAGPYALWRGLSLPRRDRWRYAGHLLAALALGIGLTAIQLLPTLELIRASQRQAITFERLVKYALELQSLPTLVSPYMYGTNAPSPLIEMPPWGPEPWRAGAEAYVGLAALMLGGVALAAWKRLPEARFWAGIAVLALVLALGDHTPAYRLWATLPVLNMMPFASRHLFEFNFAMAMLAGLGWHAIRTGAASRRAIALGVALPGLALAGLAALVLLAGPGFVAKAQTFLPQADLGRHLHLFNPALWLPMALWAGLLAAVLLVRRAPRLAPVCLLVLVLADLGLFGHHMGRLKAAPHVPADLGADFALLPDYREGRSFSVARWKYPYLHDPYAYLHQIRLPGVTLLEGLPTIHGFDAFILQRYGQVWGMVSDGFLNDEGVLAAPAHHAADVLGLRRLYLDPSVAKASPWTALDARRWQRVADDRGAVAYENTRALPRAWRVARAEVLAPEQVDARMTNDVDFEPARVALLESAPSRLDWASGTAEAANASLNRIRVSTRGQGPGLVVVSESYDPGWKAFLGQQELPLHRADALVMAVEVPSGEHTIELRYEPTRWKQGLAASAFALLLLLAWAWHARRRPRASEPLLEAA